MLWYGLHNDGIATFKKWFVEDVYLNIPEFLEVVFQKNLYDGIEKMYLKHQKSHQ